MAKTASGGNKGGKGGGIVLPAVPKVTTAPPPQVAPNVSPIIQPFIQPGLTLGPGGYAGPTPTGGNLESLYYNPHAIPSTTVPPTLPIPGGSPFYNPAAGQTLPRLPVPSGSPFYVPPVATAQQFLMSEHLAPPPTLAQQMASVYASNPRLRALGGRPGTNQPNTAFEDLYARSGLGEGLAVSGMGYTLTHGPRVPTPWEIRMQKDYGQAAGGTIAPTEVKDYSQAAGGTLAPTQPPLIVEKPPTYTPRRGGTGFENYGGGGGGTRYTSAGNGLINWRIGY